jgi:transcriptional regulator with XRE-family HTH domain
MSERDAFGPNLRRIRVQRGVSVQDITAATNVSAALWDGLERNDLARWPTGIYARAYVRSYAKAVGVDPEATVDEFCRLFPHGDRRAELVIRGHAEIIGHMDLQWRDHLPPSAADGDRRAGAADAAPAGTAQSSPTTAFGQVFGRLRALLRA